VRRSYHRANIEVTVIKVGSRHYSCSGKNSDLMVERGGAAFPVKGLQWNTLLGWLRANLRKTAALECKAAEGNDVDV
jgi:hypothetical protein